MSERSWRERMWAINPRIDPEALLSWRYRRRLTQSGLARAAGISKQFLCDVEKGRKPCYNPATQQALADALEVRVSKITMRAAA